MLRGFRNMIEYMVKQVSHEVAEELSGKTEVEVVDIEVGLRVRQKAGFCVLFFLLSARALGRSLCAPVRGHRIAKHSAMAVSPSSVVVVAVVRREVPCCL